MRRGALPGRKPGIRVSRAILRKAASMALSNSASSTSTETLTLLPSRGSTLDRIGEPPYRGAPPTPPTSGRRREHRALDEVQEVAFAVLEPRGAHRAEVGDAVDCVVEVLEGDPSLLQVVARTNVLHDESQLVVCATGLPRRLEQQEAGATDVV